MILPTFIIPGAHKSGTSFVAEALSRHTEIYFPISKEPGFFQKESIDLALYQKHFLGYEGQKHIGDATTSYMFDEDSAEMIKRFIPNVKLLFILRNPIDRVYSNYWQNIKEGKGPGLSFQEMLASNHTSLEKMIYVSRYDIHLKRFMQFFSENQILILLFNDLTNNPLKTLNRVLCFLGLDQFSHDEDLCYQVNPSAVPRFGRLQYLIANKVLYRAVKKKTPDKFLPAVKRLQQQMQCLMLRRREYPQMDNKSRNILNQRLSFSIEELSRLVGKDLSFWSCG